MVKRIYFGRRDLVSRAALPALGGTGLGEAGADAFTIMPLMGHSTVTVSQRYVHPSPEAVELAFGRLEALNL